MAGLMNVSVIRGDLLDQDVDGIVNAWNRNIIPWWLLLPQGVSGAIKRRGGTGPFKELRRHGPIPLGGAVLTSPGKLPFQEIIHVAGINMLWRASEQSIRDSVRNAVWIRGLLPACNRWYVLFGAMLLVSQAALHTEEPRRPPVATEPDARLQADGKGRRLDRVKSTT
jgi:hypothetical protein